MYRLPPRLQESYERGERATYDLVWDDAKRTAFANDPRNLAAVDGPANENKRDSPPGRWMPANERFHCQYARQFSFIARQYGLSVDRASAAVVDQAVTTCP